MGADTYVCPDAAMPYVASRAVDEGVFNVTESLVDDYDGAHTGRLPLIGTYTGAAARSCSATTPQGAHKSLTLHNIQGAAISADHAEAATFWSSLTGADPRTAGAHAISGRFAGGIAKVWPDGKVKATLSDTVAQIGAPEVRAGGDTGQGLDVAVLDTGIDAAHPDFAGRIAAAESCATYLTVDLRQMTGTLMSVTAVGRQRRTAARLPRAPCRQWRRDLVPPDAGRRQSRRTPPAR